MNYGSKTNSTGESIRANGTAPILVGEKVIGNSIEYFGLSKDQDGNPIPNIAEIRFRQSNGAVFTKKFWEPSEDWAIDNLNRDMLHICTKIVSENEYYAAVEGTKSFGAFIEAIKTKVMPKAAGKTYTMKIVYLENKKEGSPSKGQWFAGLPKFPSWIELDGTIPSSLTTNPKFDFYVVPASAKKSDIEMDVTATNDAGGSPNLF